MKSRILTGGLAIMLAAIVAVGAFGAIAANAQAPRPTTNSATATQQAAGQPIRLLGKISNTTPAGFTLTSRRGDFTVNISADTFITVEKDGRLVTGTASDLVADKATMVVGTATADAKVVDARMISQGARDGGKFLA